MILTYAIVVFLIMMSALFSGLTLGLMGLDVYDLRRKMEHGDKKAKKIYPLRSKGNLLLTTLLLGNVFVNSVMAILLGSIASGVIAGFVATGLIFVFGEIIPQAVISRHALSFGALTAPLVRVFIFILYPIVFPISLALDKVLGSEMPNIYSHNELISVIEEHRISKDSELDKDEERIARGALLFSKSRVVDVMTPMNVVTCFIKNEEVTKELIKKIKDGGFSRFPVYENEERNQIIGVLHIESLIQTNQLKGKISDFDLSDAYFIRDDAFLDEALNKFIKTKVHLFIVQDEFNNFIGVISMEDVLESILQVEVVDENDKYIDMRKVSKQKTSNKNAEKNK